MMQLARRASLVVVLLLLASVGTASAECAWPLWEQTTVGNVWTIAPIDAQIIFDTRHQCEAWAKDPRPGLGDAWTGDRANLALRTQHRRPARGEGEVTMSRP